VRVGEVSDDRVAVHPGEAPESAVKVSPLSRTAMIEGVRLLKDVLV
jgi:hypothetical protein